MYDMVNRDYALDAIFEYERMLNFPQKLSRYQALFAFDLDGVIEFIKKKGLNESYYKIYEVEANYFEKYNMNLIAGWSHCLASKMAKLYWGEGEDPNKERQPHYEYLVKLPAKLGNEVSYESLKEEYDKNNPPKENKNVNN